MFREMEKHAKFVILLFILSVNNEAIGLMSLSSYEVDVLNTIARQMKMRIDQNFTGNSCSNPAIDCECPCSSTDGICNVTRINFSNKNMKGVVPQDIGNLISLESIDLSSNKLHGTIPDSLKRLTKLKYLYLTTNNLNGHIPVFLGEMTSLISLNLGDNFFSGSIPPELANLKVSALYLYTNELSGRVPDEMGKMQNLIILSLSNNGLSGVLPPGLGHLKNLQYLFISSNEFSGEIPSNFRDLTNLEGFYAADNHFSGPLHTFIKNWSNLRYLYLIGNNFEGPFPEEISTLTNLSELFIADLTVGTGEEGKNFLFPNLSNMSSLNQLVLRNCSIEDKIPDYIGNLSLSYLDLSFNHLTGKVPNFSYPRELNYVFLTRNNLTGEIPSWVTSSSKLNADFSFNNFTNTSFVSKNFTKNLNLFRCCYPTTTSLDFQYENTDYGCTANQPKSNDLYINCGGEEVNVDGSLYEADLSLSGPSSFYVSKKKNWAYSSTGNYININEDVDVAKYNLSSPCAVSTLDASLYRTTRISPLSLKYYGLCLNNGAYNVTLHFTEIVFTSYEDHSIKGKRIFDVFIQGELWLPDFDIKKEAKGPNKAVVKSKIVNVENHLLEIHFYWRGKGSLYIDPGLYGPLISAISVKAVPKKKLPIGGIVEIEGSVLLLILVLILVILWKMGWLGNRKFDNQELKGLELFPGGFFNFSKIKAATQNFNVENKIGEGGFGAVYKGVLPNGMAIAVKQLSTKSKQGIHEFVTEVGTISSLQHPNLVRLLGCCTHDNQLLLVYEYMDNNSLSHALFGSNELKRRLDWRTRVKICLGIAKGLAFLHKECKLNIIHGDINPTNVLLDKELNAKISDFGFSKLCEEGHTHIITKIAGTTGYMAPEYAMRGHLTSKADVYSFGAVVLEIVSGKNSADYRPNEETVYLLDLAYVLNQKGNLLALVDPSLGTDYSVKEASKILNLAMQCNNPSPKLRPTMSEVVSILEGKTQMKALPTSVPYSSDDFTMAKAVADIPHHPFWKHFH